MAPLRLLIADDDPAQLAGLVEAIAEFRPEWKIVATARTVDEVLRGVDNEAPDLLLLDIHLPGSEDGSWVHRLRPGMPVVFVTGDPGFAVHAFDYLAIDYLLKPVTRARLRAALDKAAADERVKRVARSASVGHGEDNGPVWLAMSRGTDVVLVEPNEVIYLHADLKYTRLVTRRGEGLVRSGITELTGTLDPRQFVRIHRSVVVNLKFVESVKRTELGHLEVHLTGRAEVLKVSKTFQGVFKTL